MKSGLALSEVEVHEIKESSFQIIFEVDLKQTVQYISYAIKMLLGYYPYEIIGKNINSFVILSDLPKMEDAFQRVILEEMTEHVKVRVKSKDRKNIPLEIELFPIVHNRKVVGILGTSYVILTSQGKK